MLAYDDTFCNSVFIRHSSFTGDELLMVRHVLSAKSLRVD